MDKLNSQISRINEKLKLARLKDSKFKAFGSSSHQYKIGKPLHEKTIKNFEEKYNIILPASYKSFLSKIGNGGRKLSGHENSNSAAGPFYGIFALGESVDIIIPYPYDYLSQMPSISPDTTEEEWNNLTKKINDDEIGDKEYDEELGKIYSGILPIGSQGCTYYHGILLNGKHKGKVVNIDLDCLKPKFTFENNFLDWYERWLDETISGELLKDDSMWFGYSKIEKNTKVTNQQETLFTEKERPQKERLTNSMKETKHLKIKNKWYQF